MKLERLALICYHTCPLAAPGNGKTGGMNVYVREMSKHLGEMGLKVDVFTRNHGDDHDDVMDVGNNVRLVHLKGGPPGATPDKVYAHLPAFQRELERYFREGEQTYQAIHSHYWLSGRVGEKLARTWKLPHIVNFHTLAKIKMQARVNEDETTSRSDIEAKLMGSANRIIASSHHEKAAIIRLYEVPGDNIRIIPCGVDLSLFKPLDSDEVRKRLGLNGEKIVLYVGRIEPIKGLELLVQSAALIEGAGKLKVMVVGGDTGQNGDTAHLKELAERLGIGHKLEFVGVVDQRLLPLYYNVADVCVVPSHYESFSLAALEALACGTPVVASRVGGLPSVIQHGRSGYLLSWRCPEPFADSIQMILSSKGLKTSMSQAARSRAEEMGWNRVAEETYALYNSL